LGLFVVDDKPTPNRSGEGISLEKETKYQIPLHGAGNKVICNVGLKQGGSRTSGLNSHLQSQHSKAWTAFVKGILEKEEVETGAKRVIEDLFDQIEGTPPNKRTQVDVGARPSGMSGTTTLSRSPFERQLKYERHGRIQLQWEVWMTKY
jgi:hypothetical protein